MQRSVHIRDGTQFLPCGVALRDSMTAIDGYKAFSAVAMPARLPSRMAKAMEMRCGMGWQDLKCTTFHSSSPQYPHVSPSLDPWQDLSACLPFLMLRWPSPSCQKRMRQILGMLARLDLWLGPATLTKDLANRQTHDNAPAFSIQALTLHLPAAATCTKSSPPTLQAVLGVGQHKDAAVRPVFLLPEKQKNEKTQNLCNNFNILSQLPAAIGCPLAAANRLNAFTMP